MAGSAGGDSTQIRAELGPAVEPHILAYQRAFIAFFVC